MTDFGELDVHEGGDIIVQDVRYFTGFSRALVGRNMIGHLGLLDGYLFPVLMPCF
jgi:hypothetical protein